MFAHRVRLPGRLSMLALAPRPRSASLEAAPRKTSYPALRPTSATEGLSRLPSLDEDEDMAIRYLDDDDDDDIPYVDRLSASTTVLSWDDMADATDVEIVRARDTYSPLSRLSDIYKLQHLLLLQNAPARSQRSYSCNDLHDTIRKVATELVAAWRARARNSAVAPFEFQLLEWAQVIFSYEVQIYDDRCLRTMDQRGMEKELLHVRKKVEGIHAQLMLVHVSDRAAKHQATTSSSHLLDRIQKILRDVAGTHHFHRSGKVDYMQL
ncbi:hypothetical protein SPRG_01350 [Saprolegnia parasitica CBS 223.65]|uniref:Uncharacterized protein n=1 Tax=Saprolegnia parasitica (strain CBS 223.65) TaxID=695850 RepID=A0A067D5V2_SAPPC|nr:hypothetical protein SPRG_01350 [Saprolegnia parasitica CBS 223.65]KDO34076.1 hypothetical protein SPRG_01350 [Saprolegnia parasitica CBS 223.65]|eukprot:XP_012194960.1 hypothetical protein SPRG_01350 [Saprolegnia parasitica CBS 223.65]